MTIEELIERNERLARLDRWLLPVLFSISTVLGAAAAFLTSGMLAYAVMTYALSPCPVPTSTDMPRR